MAATSAKSTFSRPKPVMPSVTKATPVKAGGVRNSTGRATPPGTKPVPNKAHSTASTHQLPTAVKPATKNAVVVKAGKTPSVAVKKSASSRQVSPIPKSLGGARKPPTAVNSSSAIVKKKAAITNSQGGYYDQAMDIYSQVSSGNGGNFLNQKYVQKPFAAAGDKVANGINWVGSTVTGVGSTIKNGVDGTTWKATSYIKDYSNWALDTVNAPGKRAATASNPVGMSLR